MAEQEVILKMTDISKSFPGVKALDKANLTVKAGTVHALMGENGAGKSTLMKCLFGIYSKDSGSILLDGKEVSFSSSKEAMLGGVAMVHQELNQALTRTVQDNIWLGRYPLYAGIVVDEGKMYNATKELMQSLDLDIDPNTVMKNLPVSKRQMVEIAKAVSYGAKVLVFDEPTSSLSEAEVEQLFKILARLKAQGTGIIYISHKMEEILRISDEVTIMRDGQWIDTRPAADLTMNEIIKLMVGRELTDRFPPKNNEIGELLLSVEELSGRYSRLRDVSFNLHRGEILGIAGLDGSGRTEVLETLFGTMARKGGKISLKGKRIANKNPRDSIKNGFALITEERRATGIFGVLDIKENTVISSMNNYLKGGIYLNDKASIKNGFALITEERRATGIFGVLDIKENTVISSMNNYLKGGIYLNDKAMREQTSWSIKAMRIKTPSQETKIQTLSGGNQQKVIIGRWLLTKPEVLLMDEPTRGIDVGAKYEIYQLMLELACQGKGIIMVSSEMPELLGVADRILVMSGGTVAGEVDPKNTSQEEILSLASKFV